MFTNMNQQYNQFQFVNNITVYFPYNDLFFIFEYNSL